MMNEQIRKEVTRGVIEVDILRQQGIDGKEELHQPLYNLYMYMKGILNGIDFEQMTEIDAPLEQLEE